MSSIFDASSRALPESYAGAKPGPPPHGGARSTPIVNGSVWKTEILRDKRETAREVNPVTAFPVDPIEPTHREIYDQFLRTQQELGCIVDRGSAIYGQVVEALAWVASRAGNLASDFELDLLRSPEPNAFIIHHDDIPKPHIFITTALIEELADCYGTARQGHLRFVLGHEIAHWKEGHYDQVKAQPDPATVGEDTFPVTPSKSQLSFERAKGIFFSLAFTRDQELVADKLSLKWCSSKITGAAQPTPQEAIQVLDLLAEFAKKDSKAKGDSSSIRKKIPLVSWVGRSILATHPASEGRAARGRGVLRQLEVERGSLDPRGQKVSAAFKSPALTDPRSERACSRTPVQELSTKLKPILEKFFKDPLGNYEAVEVAVHNLVAGYSIEHFDRACAELKHLMLLLPAVYRAALRLLPLEPYGQLDKECADRFNASIKEGLPSKIEASLARIERTIQSTAERLRVAKHLALESESAASGAHLEVDFKIWLTCAAQYSCEFSDGLLCDDDGIFVRAAAEPLVALDLIASYGKQYFDLRASFNDWIYELLEANDPRVLQRGEWFASLAHSESLDLRLVLFKFFLENGLLEQIQSVEQLVRFIEKAEGFFGNRPDWFKQDIPSILGKEIRTCLERLFGEPISRSKKQNLRAFEQIRDRIVPDSREGDFILLEVAALFLQKNNERDDFAARVKWIEGNLKPGINRDLVLCRLLDIEGGGIGKYIIVENGVAELVFSKNDELVRRLLDRLVDVAHLFDGRWYSLSLSTSEFSPLLNAVERELNRERETLTDTALHSELLVNFLCNFPYRIGGPRTFSANLPNFYFGALFQAAEVQLRSLDPKEVRYKIQVERALNYCRSGLLPFITGIHFDLVTYLIDSKGQPHPKLYLEALKFGNSLPIALARCANLAGRASLPVSSLEEMPELLTLSEVVQDLPSGEFRDALILFSLASSVEFTCIEILRNGTRPEFDDFGYKRESLALLHLYHLFNPDLLARTINSDIVDSANNPSEILALLNLLRGAGEKHGSPSISLTSTATAQVVKLELLAKVYDDFSLFLRYASGERQAVMRLRDHEVKFFNLVDVATEVGRLLFAYFHLAEKDIKRFIALTPEEKFAEICSYFVYPSPERDPHLQKIIKEGESVAAKEGGDFYLSKLAGEIYDHLYSPFYRGDLGARIYRAMLTSDPGIASNFERHFNLVLATHPSGSVRREKQLKALFDGQPGGIHGVVRSWAQRDQVIKVLSEESATSASDGTLLRKGGIQLLEAALNERNVSAKERVDTVLWLAGLREQSHLVRCYEVIFGQLSTSLKDEAEKLTEDEKREFVRAVLVGPQGILVGSDLRARREFLDALFFSVFSEAAAAPERANVRYFKAVYDTMLNYIEPERAADFLGNFLIAGLDGQGFNKQVKLFFESFGFVGIKTAQYLVSSTTMIPADMREELMDLTSRVEGPDKRFVYDLAEEVYGADAREIIIDLGDRIGGGSLMSFYEVRLCDGREGVVGVLRPDIVQALPEDLLLVHRLIETMQEIPEIFGGKTISMDLMENLTWMSLVETNLARTARLQTRMRGEVQDCDHQVPLFIPEIWTTCKISGASRTVSLNRGPFIFMERAKGKTLDLYLEDLKTDPRGAEKRKLVMNRVAGMFLDQIAQHGLVHCDLHPGNILVQDDGGEISTTVLDIGLSTELDPNSTKILHRYLRLAIAHTDLSGNRSSFEQMVKEIFGIGAVEEDKARRWVAWTIEIFESELGVHWSTELKDRAINTIYELLSERDTKVQAKLSRVMDLTKELGLNFPREFYYILRGVTVMDYLWSEVDWGEQAHRFKQLNVEDQPEDLKTEPGTLNIDEVCNKVALAANRLEIPIDIEALRAVLGEAEKEQFLDKRIVVLRDGIFRIIETTSGDAQELLRVLIQDSEIRAELGIGRAIDNTRNFFDLQRGKRERSRGEFGYLAPKPLEQGLARTNAEAQEFGRLTPVWRINFYPGVMVRVVSSKGITKDTYIVLEHHSIHDSIGQAELGVCPDERSARHCQDYSNLILGDSVDIIPELESDYWSREFKPFEQREKRDIKQREIEVQRSAEEIDPQELNEALSSGQEEFIPDKKEVTVLDLNEFTNILQPHRYLKIVTMQSILDDSRVYNGDHVIEILWKGSWRPLAECMYEVGESRSEYERRIATDR